MNVITARPKNMSCEEYRVARAENKKQLRRYMKYGRTYYVSWMYTKFDIAGQKCTSLKKFLPFVGSVRRDLKNPV